MLGFLESPKQPNKVDSGICSNCKWDGLLVDADTDSEWDDFYGMDRPYPICPQCSEGLDDFYPSELN